MDILNLEGFRLFLLRRGDRKRTIKFYYNSLRRLNKELPNLNPDTIDAFLLNQLDKGKSASYINDYITALRQYDKFAGSSDFKNLKYFKEVAREKATMSQKEIEAFLSLPPPLVTKYNSKAKKNVTFIFKRKQYEMWTLFFSIFAHTGMRAGEIAGLDVNRVDFGRGVFVLEEKDTKTKSFRYVPIPPKISKDLEMYVNGLTGPLLFAGKNNRPVCDVEWGRRFHDRIKRLGIKRANLTPHSLRHSFITRLLEEDISIFKIKKIVGHKKIQTTEQYTHMTTKDIIEAIKKDPLGRKALEPVEVIIMVRDAISSCRIDSDPRFEYSLQESQDSLLFSLEVKH